MYYFYVIISPFKRIGFGIATNPQERNKQYCSHSGGIVPFVLLYGGDRAHAKALERIIKTQYANNIWQVEDWKTEWLNEDVSLDEFHQYLESLISDRHIKLKLVKTDYDFRQDLDDE